MKKLILILSLCLIGCALSEEEIHESLVQEQRFSSHYQGKVISHIVGVKENDEYRTFMRIYFTDGTSMKVTARKRYFQIEQED